MRKHKSDLIKKLDNLYDNNPKAYWQMVEQIKGEYQENKKESNIPLEDWREYFKNLNIDSNKQNDILENKLQDEEREIIFNN